MYSLSIEGGDVKDAKGVKKSVINNDLKFFKLHGMSHGRGDHGAFLLMHSE